MKLIDCSTHKYPNKVAMVDDDDFMDLSKHKWHAYRKANTFYSVRALKRVKGEGRKRVFMHRVIMGTPQGMETDHIDRNGLNNTKSNLRICTRAENGRNTITKDGTTSQFRGVHFNRAKKKFQALIRVDGKRIHLGFFREDRAAAIAYNTAAVQYHKEFATLNKMEEL